MVAPLLIPLGLVVAAAGGAGVTHAVAKRKEDKMKDAVADILTALPPDQLTRVPEKLAKVMTKKEGTMLVEKVRGLQRAAQAHAESKGQQKKRALAPESVDGLADFGIVTPMQRLGGWR